VHFSIFSFYETNFLGFGEDKKKSFKKKILGNIILSKIKRNIFYIWALRL